MDIKAAKQYRNLVLAVLSLCFVMAMTGLIMMLITRATDGPSIWLVKIGIVGIMAAYFMSLYLAIKQRNKLARPTKIAILVLAALSLPVAYGLVAILFVT